MGIKRYKPTSSGRRQASVQDFSEITATKPVKSLTKGARKRGGRNSNGRVTAWLRGGGHKRKYREIDFRRDKVGIPGTITSIEYDPNRTARIALVTYADGDRRGIL